MNIFTVEENRFSGITEKLYYDHDKVKDLYPYDFKRSDHWNERIDWLDNHPGADPAKVSDVLLALNLKLGAKDNTLANIRMLSEKHCLAVVTGQQTGLFTGPLYTIYKAITVIKQAKSLSAVTGRPVIPVFWMATEDHDYAEIAMNWNFDGNRIKRVRLSRHHRNNMPVGILPITDELIDLCEELCSDLEVQKSGKDMADLIRGTLADSKTLGEWFGRLLLELFTSWGLVILDPSDTAMRIVMQPYFKKSLMDTLTIQQAFISGTQAVSELGFRPEVMMGEGQTGIFLIDEGVRIPVYSDGSGKVFHDRHGNRHWTLDDLLTRIDSRPEDFSTGVALRPILQDWLLPVAAAVLGPSEAAYHGQLSALFAVFNRQLPVIVPRESWALAPGSDFLTKGEIIELLRVSPDEWYSDRIMDLADDQLRNRIDNNNDTYLEGFTLLIDSLPVSADARKLLIDRAVKMQERERRWMLKQIKKSVIAEASGVDDYHRFARMMKPLGKEQERTLMPWYFLSIFGRGLLNELIDMEFSMDLRIYAGGKI